MAEKTLSIRNDVPETFLELFTQGGPFAEMADLARRPGNTVDLQFRNTQGRRPWATLYLGTSKIVDIYFNKRLGLKIEPQKSASNKSNFKEALGKFWQKHPGMRNRWCCWEPLDEATEGWQLAGSDLIEFMVSAKGQAGKFTGRDYEGYLQAGIAKPGFFERWTIINRESIVAYENDQQRQSVREKALEPVDEALKVLWQTDKKWTRGKKGFGGLRAKGGPANPSSFGNKLDALGIDNDGNLLAIEVKGGYDTAGVGWTPAQVMVYTRLLRLWLKETKENPHEVLARSLNQRRSLGLAGTQELATNFEIIPVIVIGGMVSSKSAEEATSRMNLVRDALMGDENDLDGLRIFQLEGTGLSCTEIHPGEGLRTAHPG